LQAQEKSEGRIPIVARVVRLGNCRFDAAVKPALAPETHQNDQIIIDSECSERFRLLIHDSSLCQFLDATELTFDLLYFVSKELRWCRISILCSLCRMCTGTCAARKRIQQESLPLHITHIEAKKISSINSNALFQAVLHLHVVITIFENFPMGCVYQLTIGSSK